MTSEIEEAQQFIRAVEALSPEHRELLGKLMKAMADGTITFDEMMSQLRVRIS